MQRVVEGDINEARDGENVSLAPRLAGTLQFKRVHCVTFHMGFT